MKISIVIPVFNEVATLRQVLQRVLSADVRGLDREVVLVDDGSTDGTRLLARELAEAHGEVILVEHPENRGKGAALRSGFHVATGDLLLIQDGDLEYDPADYPALLAPLLSGEADVVFGSRFRQGSRSEVPLVSHLWANRALTALSNLLSGMSLTDMETCYKVFPRALASRLELREDRFGVEPELTAKVARLRPRPRVVEVPIRYQGRRRGAGKKISCTDGLRAVYCILRYNMPPRRSAAGQGK